MIFLLRLLILLSLVHGATFNFVVLVLFHSFFHSSPSRHFTQSETFFLSTHHAHTISILGKSFVLLRHGFARAYAIQYIHIAVAGGFRGTYFFDA